MKLILSKSIILTIVIFISLFCRCTGNPFGDDKISAGRRQISGQVLLNDGASPEGVYVWQKRYNILTQTDQEGNFKILLPPQSKQVTSTGTVELDTLYFYLANYLLETALVMIVEGEFYYDRADIDKDGKLRRPIVLQRFLRISTYVNPPSIQADSILQADSSVTITVKTQLQADIDCAEVGIPKINQADRRKADGPLGVILVKNLDSDEVYIVRSDSSAEGNFILTVCATTVIRDLRFDFPRVQFPPGRYEIIPYIFVNPKGVPRRLLEIVNIPFNYLGSNYLNKPMRRKDGHFEILN